MMIPTVTASQTLPEVASDQTMKTPRSSATTTIGTVASVNLEGMLHCFDADSDLTRPATFAPMPKTLTTAWSATWD